jgi:uncharacterized protein (TIGR00369 family)
MSECEHDPSNERASADDRSTTDLDRTAVPDRRADPDGRTSDDGKSESFSAATLDRMQGFIDDHGYLSWLGVELESAAPGRAVMTVPYRKELTNPTTEGTPRTHGGIPATLIDTASGFALRTTFADPGRATLTTADLDVSYLRPATDDLCVESEVVRAGNTVGVTRASVTSVAPDGKRKEVAIGTATYRLFRDRGGIDETDGAEGASETCATDETDAGDGRNR